MATAVSARPAAPTTKVKRPVPPPALQTTPNGTGSQSSPSPSLSSKRPPSGFKHPPSAGIASNGGHASPNVTGPRPNRRKDSQQKPVEGSKPRLSKTATNDTLAGDRRPQKRVMEPYVRSTSYMLKRNRKSAPSLIVHLHPTHFRLDQQEGSFSYNSPARKLLEHIKDQTVPHDMLDEFHQAGVKFYDGCLIVQVHDHRNTAKDAASTSTSAKKDGNQPYSIHNYTQHLTPSPYVPYPSDKAQDEGDKPAANAPEASEPASKPSSNKGKSDQESSSSKAAHGPRVFTTVLFPTALTLQEDILRYACTVDPRTVNRKGSQIGNSRTGSVTSTGAGPATASGPPAKKQKLQYSNKTLKSIESTIILSTAPPLYLDPVKDAEEAQALLDKLKDPLCCREHPAPKSRKRTVAELAADEALAAEEQRFMLIMDERHPSSTTAGTGKAGTDGDGNDTNFEARFERFKTLEEIKELNSQKKERDAQQAQQAQALKAKAEQDRANEQRAQMRRQQEQQQIIRNQSLHQTGGPQQLLQAQQQQQQQNQQQHQVSTQQQVSHGPSQHAHPATSSAAVPNAQQLATSQASQSSPVARNMTPQNASSPAMASALHRGASAVPMNMTNSTQGAGSPPRPGSALQHGHPGPAAMVAQRSQQPPPSRNGTPSMPNGTPRIQQATPVMRNLTPTPRMSQASPVNSAAAGTPMMAHSMLGAAHINGQPQLTPQQAQQQAFLRHQQQQQHARQQAQRAQAFHQSQQMQGSPPNAQLQQQHLQQQIAAHQAQQRAGMQGHDQDVYRQMLHNMNQQQMHANAGGHGMTNGMMMHQGQNPFANQQQQNFGGAMGGIAGDKMRIAATQHAQTVFNSMKMNAMQQYGPNIPADILANMKTQAMHQARQHLVSQQRKMAQQAMMNQMQQNGGMNGMGGM